MALNQDERLLSLDLAGKDIVLTGFSGNEEMSRLFDFQLDMISDDNAIDPHDVVGKNVTFSVKKSDNSPRHFNGFVNSFALGDEDIKGRRNYRAQVVPWLWFLTRTTDCRIFQEMSLPDIIKQVFDDLGFSDYDDSNISGNHPTHEYRVQYRESDFNFVSRLLEEEGMFYFFTHEEGKHTLVLADKASAYQDCEEATVDYPTDAGSRAMEDYLTQWEHRVNFRTGKWAQTDYNFKTPSTSLMTSEPTVMKLPDASKYEYYDYPGVYVNTGDGRDLTRLRMEEVESDHDVVHAAGLCKTFTAGHKFKVGQHKSDSEEGKGYLITSIEHYATEPLGYETGAQAGDPYRNTFTCIPDSVTFRPARSTRKPMVQGPQTAIVVGPSGEEIFTDEFGRVKVQFYWDREGEKDENSSCWIRVSQNWAGNKWGIVFNPRIGQEVIVDFLEGDPDRPIITGRVYNAEQMPPYELPAEQTKSTIKTRSSKDGDEENFNEIRFEDKKGDEQLFIHAEKNQDIEVENDETHWVGHDRRKTIDNDEETNVGRDRTETVARDESIVIQRDRSEQVSGEETVSIGKSRTSSIGKDETNSVAENRTETIGKNEEVGVAGDRSHDVGGNDQLTVGKELLITAGNRITLKTGKASIILQSSGKIEIDGSDITIKGTGKINVKASSDVNIKGSKVKAN